MGARSRSGKGRASGSPVEPTAGRAVRLVEPQAARVIDDLVAALLDRDRFEKIVVDEDDEEVAAGQRAVEVDQFGAGARELQRQAACVRLDDLDLLAETAREPGAAPHRGALAAHGEL